MVEIPDQFRDLAKDVANGSNGARLYLVGGAIRDHFFSRPPKDFDFCLTGFQGIRPALEFLLNYGRAYVGGLNMPVINFKGDLWTETIQIALARVETSSDYSSYNDVDFSFGEDRVITIEEDLKRRDITWNSMAIDILTGDLIDPYHGISAMAGREIVATDLSKFKTSIERPLRIGVLLARDYADVKVSPKLVGLCREMGDHVEPFGNIRNVFITTGVIPREQLWLQFEKAMNAPRFDLFLQWLVEINWLRHFPNLHNTLGIPQDPVNHPEGDVWYHTLHTVRAMQKELNSLGIVGKSRHICLLAALGHDLDKTITTELRNKDTSELISADLDVICKEIASGEWEQRNLKVTSYGHELGTLADRFLRSIGCPSHIRVTVMALIPSHMAHLSFGDNPSKKQIIRLVRKIFPASPEQLYRLMLADHAGRPPLPADPPSSVTKIYEMSKDVMLVDDELPGCPVLGRHLIRWGLSSKDQGYTIPYFGDSNRRDTIIGLIFMAQLEEYFGDPLKPDPELVRRWVQLINWGEVYRKICSGVPSEEIVKGLKPEEV